MFRLFWLKFKARRGDRKARRQLRRMRDGLAADISQTKANLRWQQFTGESQEPFKRVLKSLEERNRAISLC